MADRRFTVLVVDDSAMFRLRVNTILHDLNLHPVLHARNYEEAYECLVKTVVHLVLLDISMPGKNGIELLQFIKKEYPVTKVLIISNHANDHYKKVCLSYGAHYFFDKSHDFEQIAKIVQHIRDETDNQPV